MRKKILILAVTMVLSITMALSGAMVFAGEGFSVEEPVTTMDPNADFIPSPGQDGQLGTVMHEDGSVDAYMNRAWAIRMYSKFDQDLTDLDFTLDFTDTAENSHIGFIWGSKENSFYGEGGLHMQFVRSISGRVLVIIGNNDQHNIPFGDLNKASWNDFSGIEVLGTNVVHITVKKVENVYKIKINDSEYELSADIYEAALDIKKIKNYKLSVGSFGDPGFTRLKIVNMMDGNYRAYQKMKDEMFESAREYQAKAAALETAGDEEKAQLLYELLILRIQIRLEDLRNVDRNKIEADVIASENVVEQTLNNAGAAIVGTYSNFVNEYLTVTGSLNVGAELIRDNILLADIYGGIAADLTDKIQASEELLSQFEGDSFHRILARKEMADAKILQAYMDVVTENLIEYETKANEIKNAEAFRAALDAKDNIGKYIGYIMNLPGYNDIVKRISDADILVREYGQLNNWTVEGVNSDTMQIYKGDDSVSMRVSNGTASALYSNKTFKADAFSIELTFDTMAQNPGWFTVSLMKNRASFHSDNTASQNPGVVALFKILGDTVSVEYYKITPLSDGFYESALAGVGGKYNVSSGMLRYEVRSTENGRVEVSVNGTKAALNKDVFSAEDFNGMFGAERQAYVMITGLANTDSQWPYDVTINKVNGKNPESADVTTPEVLPNPPLLPEPDPVTFPKDNSVAILVTVLVLCAVLPAGGAAAFFIIRSKKKSNVR